MKFKKKTSLSLSLSLLVDLLITLIFPKGCACTSLSLFLSPFTFAKTVWIQIRPKWNSGNNVSSIKKMCSCAIESTQSVVQKPMRTIKWVLSHCPVPCADPEGGISYQYWNGSPEIIKTTKPAFNVGPSSARQ